MILFRQRYPRWWFDFSRQLTRFAYRVGAYLWLPLVKWFLAIPHYIVLAFLAIGAVLAMLFAWFAILFTGRYPKGLFDIVCNDFLTVLLHWIGMLKSGLKQKRA